MKLTVRDFLKYIKDNNIPHNTELSYQRIEDRYFDGIDISGMRGINGIYPPNSKAEGWNTIKVKGETYYNAVMFNKHIEDGKLVKEGKLDPRTVGKFFWGEEYEDSQKPIDLSDENLLDQFVNVNSIYYNKESNILCLTAHY